MFLLFAMLICGTICAIAQLLSELKVPYWLIVLLIMTSGGILGHFGIYEKLSELSSAGALVTALGCGNGAYNGALSHISSGSITFILAPLLLNVILIGVGAIAGRKLYKDYSNEFDKNTNN